MGRVQHDSNTAAHSSGRKVGLERGIHETRVSVHLAHLAKDRVRCVGFASEPAHPLACARSLHNVGALLAHVPLGLRAARDVLNLEDGNVRVLGVLLPEGG